MTFDKPGLTVQQAAMSSARADPNESSELPIFGPEIPGMPGQPAFSLAGRSVSPLPVLIAAPHGGRAYPPELLRRMRHPERAAMRLEDRHADSLARAVAMASGAVLLVAHAPRAMIDLNRAPDDVDWEMIERAEQELPQSTAAGRRARTGLGLIPRRLPGIGELWKERHGEADLKVRIAGIHEPYHRALADILERLRRRWGAALLLDLHSMPPLPARPGVPAPEFVIGDRFGTSCDARLPAAAFACLAEAGRRAAHNRPYAGDYVLHRHAAPAAGVNAMQLEIDRRSYLNERLEEPGDSFDALVRLLVGLVRRLGAETAALGSGEGPASWAEAAE